MEGRAGAFWEWSLATYPKVEGALLDLQDRHGVDVNLALFCTWIGRLSPEALDEAEAALRPWREEVVEPLRKIRRKLKGNPGAEGLRRAAKAAEIEAERLGQARLVAAVPEPCGSGEALALYLDRRGVPEASRAGLDALRDKPKSFL